MKVYKNIFTGEKRLIPNDQRLSDPWKFQRYEKSEIKEIENKSVRKTKGKQND
jgi:hypothetical protein